MSSRVRIARSVADELRGFHAVFAGGIRQLAGPENRVRALVGPGHDPAGEQAGLAEAGAQIRGGERDVFARREAERGDDPARLELLGELAEALGDRERLLLAVGGAEDLDQRVPEAVLVLGADEVRLAALR